MPALIVFFALCIALGVLVAVPLASFTRED